MITWRTQQRTPIYNSVPYVEEEMAMIKNKIQQLLCNNSFDQYTLMVSDVAKGISHLMHGRTDGAEGLYSDPLITHSEKSPARPMLFYSTNYWH